MTQAAFSTLPGLANVLERFCREGRSGTLHVVTSDNHTAFFGLLVGQIVAVRYRIRKDKRALEHLLGMNEGRYTFTEDADVEHGDGSLPSTSEILAMLGAANPDLSAAVQTAPAGAPALTSEPLPPVIQDMLSDTLVQYAGPAAKLLSRSIFASTADANEAVELLAKKIPDATQAQAFSREAKRRLESL